MVGQIPFWFLYIPWNLLKSPLLPSRIPMPHSSWWHLDATRWCPQRSFLGFQPPLTNSECFYLSHEPKSTLGLLHASWRFYMFAAVYTPFCFMLPPFGEGDGSNTYEMGMGQYLYRYIFSGLFTSINPSYDLGWTKGTWVPWPIPKLQKLPSILGESPSINQRFGGTPQADAHLCGFEERGSQTEGLKGALCHFAAVSDWGPVRPI